ncbi:hypothetical protein [Streptomyces sp. NPDC059783]|uniref:hypothetical protein n=1 Tax=Streptomyces sp. NPDC059783 TaxID=3346944 RepID=UPI00366573E1
MPASPGRHGQHVNSGVTEVIERQNQAMRELSRRAFTEPDIGPDDVPAPLGQARTQRSRQAAPPSPGE